MRKIPLGISDFKKIIVNDYYYVDKTLLIKEFFDLGPEVILLTRPRRFGKTLNLSMLQYFFEKTSENHNYLFKNTEIWKHQDFVQNNQGKYPIIFLTFKDIKETNWEAAYDRIIGLIVDEFRRHQSNLKPILEPDELEQYNLILHRKASEAVYSDSLRFLSSLLNRHFKSKVIALIDEYDTPVHTGYFYGFYEQMTSFLRNLLPPLLKDNNNLERGFLTGILTIAKAGILSGLNNLKTFTITNQNFQDKFGFNEQEVINLLKEFNLNEKKEDVDSWYNGYIFGNNTIYNPWSLLNFVHEKGIFQLYWVNTADNKIIKKLIEHSLQNVKLDLNALLSGQSISSEIDEAIIFPGIEVKPYAIWSLFLFTGYLTFKECNFVKGRLNCALTIPNAEILTLYEEFIKEIFSKSIRLDKVEFLIKAIVNGDAKVFQQYLQEFIINSMSYYDISKEEPEQSYHIFILGLLVFMSDDYNIKSNRESGAGRYDIALIPKDKQNPGIVIEFKKSKKVSELKLSAQNALDQIKMQNYDQEIKSLGIKNIINYGIAFTGKNVLILTV